MNKVIVNVKPFVLNQKIDVFTDDNYLSSVNCTMDNLVEIVMSTVDEYNCDKITFTGSYPFCARYADKIQQDNFIKYSKPNLIVEVL